MLWLCGIRCERDGSGSSGRRVRLRSGWSGWRRLGWEVLSCGRVRRQDGLDAHHGALACAVCGVRCEGECDRKSAERGRSTRVAREGGCCLWLGRASAIQPTSTCTDSQRAQAVRGRRGECERVEIGALSQSHGRRFLESVLSECVVVSVWITGDGAVVVAVLALLVVLLAVLQSHSLSLDSPSLRH